MSTQSLSRKKLAERCYVEEARRSSSIFPRGELVAQERPDFLLHGDEATIGIEVTELCREEPRAEAGRLAKAPDRAKAIYDSWANAEDVGGSIAFSPRHAQKVSLDKLTYSLAEFVYAHRSSKGSSSAGDRCLRATSIGVYAPRVPGECWHSVTAFDTAIETKGLLESRIADKNQHVADYRRATPEVWLLIINDRFLGPGEVYVRPDHAAAWEFIFDFERVLLFLREAGGGGEVVELRQARGA